MRTAGVLLFGLALSLYIATTGGSMATDIMSYEVTKEIVEHGSVAMSYNVFQMDAHRGVDGRYYAPYGIGHAVYSIPFYALARAAERWTGLAVGKREAIRKAGFVVGSAVAAALIVWVAFLFAWRLSNDVRAAMTTALAVGFATFLWPYAKFGFSAPLATLSVLAGTYGVWAGPRLDRPAMLALGGAGLGGALLVKHELALVCLPVGVWIVIESRYDWRLIVRRGLLAGLPVVAAVIATFYYNAVRFGNPLDTGYLRDETVLMGSFWTGVAGLLFSPGRSVFLYSPVTLAGLWALIALGRRDRSTMVLLAGEFAVMLCFYASFTHWDGERSYGPRYLLPVVPFLVLPLAPWLAGRSSRTVAQVFRPACGGTEVPSYVLRHERRAVRHRLLTALVVLSVLVQVPGVLVDFSKVGRASEVGYPTMDERRWTWEASGLYLNTRASLAAMPENVKNLATGNRPAVKPAQADARDFSDQFAFSLDFWWVYLFYLGAVSAPLALALGVLCFGAAALFGWRLSAALSRQSSAVGHQLTAES